MANRAGIERIHPGWWTLILVTGLAVTFVLAFAFYAGSFKSYVHVSVTSDRTGLVMETGNKVMMSGVQVGRVSGVTYDSGPTSLQLEIDPDKVNRIPANVGAQIRATTAFGGKYLDFIYPRQPSAQRLRGGEVIRSQNVSTEVNTVFENLVGLLHQVDPAKLNAILGALSEGFRGQGDRIGTAISDANEIFTELNSRNDTIDADFRSLRGFSDSYAAAAPDIVSILDNITTTGQTITRHASALDSLLVNVIGFAQQGNDLLAPNEQRLIDAVNILAPTTSLLMKYQPEYTCMLVGAKFFLDNGGYANIGGNGKSFLSDSAIHLGKDAYRYPDNLPIVAAQGGPGGKPGCGSLPDVSKNMPVRFLVTDTGWGTGMDLRPNVGVAAQNCYADYLPATRAVPQPPSLRQCLNGPAPGPVTAPGMPPYGAALYGPGGEPLWPGLPPAGTPPPVQVPGTPVAPGKIPPQLAPSVFGEQPPLLPDQAPRPVFDTTAAPPTATAVPQP